MFELLAVYLCASLILLLGASEIERRAIVARRLGPNGRAFLWALVISAAGSLGVTVATAFLGDWVDMLHVLGASIVYHGFMGAFLVHGLQEVSARVANQGTS
jgi:membrane associated rhomboid family serine protease